MNKDTYRYHIITGTSYIPLPFSLASPYFIITKTSILDKLRNSSLRSSSSISCLLSQGFSDTGAQEFITNALNTQSSTTQNLNDFE